MYMWAGKRKTRKKNIDQIPDISQHTVGFTIFFIVVFFFFFFFLNLEWFQCSGEMESEKWQRFEREGFTPLLSSTIVFLRGATDAHSPRTGVAGIRFRPPAPTLCSSSRFLTERGPAFLGSQRRNMIGKLFKREVLMFCFSFFFFFSNDSHLRYLQTNVVCKKKKKIDKKNCWI